MFASLTSTFYQFFPYLAACMARRREAQYAEREARRRQARFQRPQLEWLGERIVPAPFQYIGPAGGDWTNGNFWQNQTTGAVGQVPGSMDTATIGPNSSGYCILNSTTPQAVAGLTVAGGCRLDLGSQLSVTTMVASGTFNMAAGSELDVLGSADFTGTGTISGHIDDQGGNTIFDASSSMTLAPGTSLTGSLFSIFGPVTVTANLSQQATMVLDDPSGTGTGGGSLTGPGSMSDSGEFDWNGGVIGLAGGAYFQADADLKLDTSEAKELSNGCTLTNQCNGSSLGGTGTLLIDSGTTFDNLGNPNCTVTISSIIVSGPSPYVPSDGTFINDADGFFDEEGQTTIAGNFINNGIIDGGGTLTLTAGKLDGRLMLDGGTVIVAGDMTSPTGVVLGPGSGALQIGDPVHAASGSLTVGGGAAIVLAQGTLEVTEFGAVTGGTLDNNSGVVQVDAIGYGPLYSVSVDAFIQTTSAQLTIQVAGPSAYPILSVGGNASLAGTLNFDYIDGYTPSSGDAFTMLTAGSISGDFNVIPPDTTATYSPNTVTITED